MPSSTSMASSGGELARKTKLSWLRLTGPPKKIGSWLARSASMSVKTRDRTTFVGLLMITPTGPLWPRCRTRTTASRKLGSGRSLRATRKIDFAGSWAKAGATNPMANATQMNRNMTLSPTLSQGRGRLLAPRCDSPQLAVGCVGDDIQRAVAALAHVADALAAIGEQVLLARHAVVLDHEAHEPRLPERADEKAAAPRGKRVAGVELRARRRDDGIPVIGRALVPGAIGDGAIDPRSRIFDAVRDD